MAAIYMSNAERALANDAREHAVGIMDLQSFNPDMVAASLPHRLVWDLYARKGAMPEDMALLGTAVALRVYISNSVRNSRFKSTPRYKEAILALAKVRASLSPTSLATDRAVLVTQEPTPWIYGHMGPYTAYMEYMRTGDQSSPYVASNLYAYVVLRSLYRSMESNYPFVAATSQLRTLYLQWDAIFQSQQLKQPLPPRPPALDGGGRIGKQRFINKEAVQQQQGVPAPQPLKRAVPHPCARCGDVNKVVVPQFVPGGNREFLCQECIDKLRIAPAAPFEDEYEEEE